jgi:acyl carrier protein
VFVEVLEVAEIGVDDDFFDLGGHSMLTVRVRDRIREETGLEVPIADLFRHPRVADLAAHLSDTTSDRR